MWAVLIKQKFSALWLFAVSNMAQFFLQPLGATIFSLKGCKFLTSCDWLQILSFFLHGNTNNFPFFLFIQNDFVSLPALTKNNSNYNNATAMKRNVILTLCLTMVFAVGWAQPPHKEAGYDPSSKILATVAYGYGNSVDQVIISGKDQTSIKVNSNGFPTEIVNSVTNLDFQYAGTGSVTVTQTVNGEKKTEKLSLDSKQVLSFREEYSKFKQNPSLFDKVDGFFANGGAKMIGFAIDLITRDKKLPIEICINEAIRAAKQTENPIIPINDLQKLKDAIDCLDLKGLVTDNYNKITEGVADYIYKREMELYNQQKDANRTKVEARLELGRQLLEEGHDPSELSKLIDQALHPEPNNARTANDNGANSGQGNNGQTAQGNGQQGGQGSVGNSRGTKEMLETTFFYFDNPDGTIEAFPEYCYPDLKNRMMSISSSKYATPMKNKKLEGTLKQYESLLNLYFGRQTRTTVFVFDGQESAKAAMMTTMVYSSSILGLWAALEDGMREKFSRELAKANIAHTTSATWKDAIKQGKPEELTFNGHEGGRIVNRIDLSNSWLSLLAGANIEMVFDNYFYYDEEFDKMIGVVFVYSEVSNPKNKYEAIAYTAIKALSGAMGYTDPTTGNTTLASMFEHRDMIDFFKKHFHLKKQTSITQNPPKCIANYVGTPQKPSIELCGDTADIGIDILIGCPGPEDETPPTKENPPVEPPVIGDPPIDPPIIGNPPVDPPIIGDPPIDPPIIGDPPGEEGGGGNKQIDHSKSKFAVIGQLNHASVEKPFAENDEYIFFMQSTYGDNAVLAVHKPTGDLKEVVPGKRKGERPGIISIGAYGKDLYLDVEGRGIVRYDGKDVKTSELICEIDRGFMDDFKKITFSPNGRYMAYGGQNCHNYVFDLKNGNKLIKSFHDGLQDFLVTDDGDFFGVNNFRALVYRNNGNPDGDATSVVEMGDLLKDKPLAIRQIGDDIYIAGGKKVMKTAAKEFKWTETSSITSEGLMLFDGALGTNGWGFAYMTDRALNRFVRFNISNDSPSMQKKLSTGINVGQRNLLVVETAGNFYIDSLGNIWMIEQSGAGFVVVYNPEGLAGLQKIAGKFVKQ